jgi:hypothetical protein
MPSTCILGVVAMATMRLSIITAALAPGLVALWVANALLATQQASTSSSPAMMNAFFICHMQQGIDQICATALAQALVIEQRKYDPMATADRACRADPRTLPQGPGARS